MPSSFRIRPLFFLILAAAALAGLSGCSLSLAQDVTPPPGVIEMVSTEPAPVEVAMPVVPLDTANGQAIYAESCAPCHGSDGLGSGPQASGLPNPPSPLGSAEFAREARPADWYEIVTSGNLERFMPPFAGSLSERQRWDVVAYALSLSISDRELTKGKVIYAEQCESCHGPEGKGDGPRVSELAASVPDWTEPAVLVQRSNEELYSAITSGTPNMPSFSDSLSEEQRWSLAAYVRSLSFAHPSAPMEEQAAAEQADPSGQAPAAQNSSSEAAFTIEGTVTNGSGGAVPPDLHLSLQGYDSMQPAMEMDAEIKKDGSYRFRSVAMQPGRAYVVSAEYKGTQFFSNIIQASDVAAGSSVRLPLTIYETSTDSSRLVADRAHIFLEFSQPNTIQVVELFIISNPTNRVIIPKQQGTPVLSFDLPEGASSLQFESGALGGRFVQTAEGFGDTLSVLPGSAQHQVLFGYQLPYDGSAELEFRVPVEVMAMVLAVPGENGVRVQSSQLREAGQRELEGVKVNLYSANEIMAGTALQVELSGRPRTGAQISSGTAAGLVLGGGVFLLVAAFAVMYFVQQRRPRPVPAGVDVPSRPDDSAEGLLDAIVTLDDLYRSGQLPVDAYQQRRAELKERLRAKTKDGG